MLKKEQVEGKIIVFEGLDHSFKETNSQALLLYFKEHVNPNTMLVAFPRYAEKSSRFVRKYLAGKFGDLNSLDPHTVSTFYALDRFETIHRLEINKLLKEGWTIIFDRYIGSNLLFQGSKFGTIEELYDYINWCTDLEYNKNKLPKEDIVLFMNLNRNLLDSSKLHNRDKEGIKNDLHESNELFMKNVEDFSSIVVNHLNWKRVKCNHGNQILSKTEIFDNILKTLEENLTNIK